MVNISLPAIVFSKIYPLILEEKIFHLVLCLELFILFNLLLSYFIGKMMQLNKVFYYIYVILLFGNIFIGFSYIDAFYGDEYIVYGLIYDLFGSFLLLVSYCMFIITWGKNKKNSIMVTLKQFFYFLQI